MWVSTSSRARQAVGVRQDRADGLAGIVVPAVLALPRREHPPDEGEHGGRERARLAWVGHGVAVPFPVVGPRLWIRCAPWHVHLLLASPTLPEAPVGPSRPAGHRPRPHGAYLLSCQS